MTTPEYKVTEHAKKRIRERLGINKSGVIREAVRGEAGMPPEFLTGSLRVFIDRIIASTSMKSPGAIGTTRVTSNAIFIYCNGSLVTVMLVPRQLRGSVRYHWGLFKADQP